MAVVEIVIAGIVLCLAGMAQSVIGFGYALFATPLLLLGGLPLPSVITLVATGAMCQTIIGARHLRQDIPWKISGAAFGVRLAGLVGGIVMLKQLVTLDRDTVQMVVGGVLCLMVVTQVIWRPKPQERVQPFWAGLAFLASGFLSGLCGMGGPPIVLWSMTQPWTAHRTRAFLFVVLGTLIPVQLTLLSLTFGAQILWQVLTGLLMFPLVYLGSTMGLRIGHRIEKNQLQRMAYAVLLIMGVTAVAPALKLL